MIDDAELLRRYVDARSEEAFAELVKRHLNLVYHAALRRTGDSHLAEDAAQNVFIDLARNATALSGHTALVGWLYTTARFAANRIAVAELRRRLREQEVYAMQDGPSTPVADWDEVRPALDEVLEKLSDQDRTAVLLRYFEGRSFAEIGRTLRLTEEAARKRAERGVEKLGKLLRRRGINSTAASLTVILCNQSALAAPAGLASTIIGKYLIAQGSQSSAFASSAEIVKIMSVTKIQVAITGLVVAAVIGSFFAGEHHARLTKHSVVSN